MLFPKYSILSESAVCVTFGEKPEEGVWQQVQTLDARLRERPFPGLLATVPAIVTLTVHFDPMAVFRRQPMGIPAAAVLGELKNLGATLASVQDLPKTLIKIPVRYGGAFGTDLPEVVDRLQLSEAEVIQLHSETLLRVLMIGFAPGFPYMGLLPSALELPRKKTISRKVPAGSVAIAGNMTCIYPNESPAGWHVIGQTELKLFDAFAPEPCLLSPGMQVRFISIKT
ncbi:MAG: 5-oxoprolinase subunit PxpB [Saprospiraceae bacterium]|nr:5-oxoprolinase subunit PxpB [Saprospiraceae bacterium]MDZ4703891.1 5-oxoprolinase subunit PxpB [Saprospiraceae bacterium]